MLSLLNCTIMGLLEVMVGCENSICLEATVRDVDMVSPINRETGDLQLYFSVESLRYCTK